jgi:hypothetical protein
MKKNGFFGPVPKSHTQMGSLSAKNANEKFSRLGTFKRTPSARMILYAYAQHTHQFPYDKAQCTHQLLSIRMKEHINKFTNIFKYQKQKRF